MPMVLLESENQPCAVLFDPVVLKLSALTFSAALLPLPRSSPAELGDFACTMGKSTKHATASGMKNKPRRTGDRLIKSLAIRVVVFDLNKVIGDCLLLPVVDPATAQ